jgi:hypothetical protein
MQEYDVALKLLLRGSAQLTIRELTGASVETWIDAELARNFKNLRVDLLGETAEGGLVHLELQSSNDSAMALRMRSTPSACFAFSGDLRTRFCSMSASRRFEWKSELRGPDVFFRYEANCADTATTSGIFQ